jgi:hypothetical protein
MVDNSRDQSPTENDLNGNQNAKIHKAARTEKGHLVRPTTLGPPSHGRQLMSCPCKLAASHLSSTKQCAIRLAKCMIAFSVAAGLSIRQQWADETSATLVDEMAHPLPPYTKQLVGIHNEAR